MSKLKLISLLAIGLLFINLCLMAYIVLGKPPSSGKDGPKSKIIQLLKFDKEQQTLYQQAIDEHRNAIHEGDEQIRELKNELYRHLNTGISIKEKDSLIAGIAQVQQRIESIHYAHFEQIRALCRPGQMKDFEALTKELCAIFSHPRPERKKP